MILKNKTNTKGKNSIAAGRTGFWIRSIAALVLTAALIAPDAAFAKTSASASSTSASTTSSTSSTSSTTASSTDASSTATSSETAQKGLYSTVNATKITVRTVPELTPGQSIMVMPTVTPSNAYGKITYKSADESIARVNEAGMIVAYGKGTTKIKATAYGGASCTFTVKVTGSYGKLKYKLNKAKTQATITGCDANATAVKIPATYKGVPVTKIAGDAFAECKCLRFFVVDKAQETFYEEDGVLFTDKPVKTLVRMPNYYSDEYDENNEYCVPEGTESIGEYAFAGLNRYLDIYLPDSVTKLGDRAFYKIAAQSSLYTTENLTDLGEELMLDQRSNVAFYVQKWDSHIADYCNEHFIPCGTFFDFEARTKTVKTKKIKASSAKNFKEPSAKKTVYYDVDENMAFSEYWHESKDLSSYQTKDVKQVKIRFDKEWKELIPDADGNTRGPYPAMTGIYGIGYTEGSATLVGYDLNGKITGISKVKDDFAFALEGAAILGVVGGKNTVLTATPHEITFVTEPGYLPFEPDEWIKYHSGKGFRYIAVCFPYGNVSLDFPNYLNVLSNSYARDTYGEMSGESAHYSLMTVGFNSVVRMGESAQTSVHVDGLEQLCNTEEFVCFAKRSLGLDEEYGKKANDILKTVKKVMLGTYYPKDVPVSKITLSLNGDYPSSSENKIGVDDYFVTIDDPSTIASLAHEMTHAIDQSILQMEITPNTWWEGRAQYVEEKVLKELGINDYQVNEESYDWSFLNDADKEDFFHYYFFNYNRQTPYVVGYFFQKYICDTYGDDVSGKIMRNIAAITLEDMPKESSRYVYADLPKEQQAELFFECVTKETSKTVFDDFVRDVIDK